MTPSIVSRAGGNPFFAEEMVRDLNERGVLDGHRGAYVCRSNAADMRVPATLQATIAARIDRLDAGAKRTLNGAAVIGSRFDTDLLNRIDINPVLDELITSELIDHVRFAPRDEYAFHHPLIRSVAYESQLKSDRAQLHLRLAASLEEGDPESADLNSAVIAEHLEAGGDLRSAYSWHMRAGSSATNHDIAAARVSWTRARRVADSLPEDDSNRIADAHDQGDARTSRSAGWCASLKPA